MAGDDSGQEQLALELRVAAIEDKLAALEPLQEIVLNIGSLLRHGYSDTFTPPDPNEPEYMRAWYSSGRHC
jgi:hypothetical protein